MRSIIPESELILNSDGSIYHLHLLPEDIADTIILVGDPNRVELVSKYFDKIEIKKQKREFITHTGYIGKKRLTVISTGIGTDNIDIVLNELDALANINLNTREVNSNPKVLKFIRIGTSGSLQESIPVDSTCISSYGLGLDSLMHFYDYEEDQHISDLLNHIDEALEMVFINPYLFKAPGNLLQHFGNEFHSGITASCCGFYAPQGRMLRMYAKYENILKKLSQIHVSDLFISNFEMETSGIYGLASIMGHEALSVNAIVANRINQTFSKHADKTIDNTIQKTLQNISKL